MISIIIPVRNRPALLDKCVQRVKELAKGEHEIIVVDDASVGGIGMQDSDVHVLVNPVSLGPGGARNAGAREAKGDILFFIDSDIILCADAFEIVNECITSQKYDALQGMFSAQAAYPDFFSVYKNLYWNFNQSKMDPGSYNLCTAIFAIRKETFLKLGGFNETSLVGEDREFGVLLQKSHVRMLQAKELQGTHYKSFNFKSLVLHHFQNAVNCGTFILKGTGISMGNRKSEILGIVLIPMLLLPIAAFFFVLKAPHILFWICGLCVMACLFLTKDFVGYCAKQKGVLFAMAAFLMHALEYNIAFVGLAWSVVRFSLFQRKDLNFRFESIV